MGHDYYDILNISRNSKDADIKIAYRKLALKIHPLKNANDVSSYDKFSLISEAYDILSDPSKRAVYDQFGEEGLKHGIPHGSVDAGAWTSGYVYHGNPDKTFSDFFGSENPFQEFYDRMDGDMHLSFGGLYGRSQRNQDPFIERDLNLTLEEVFHGCIKKIKISRRVMNDDGHTSSIRDKILTVNVQCGWKEGTRVTFMKEGDQGPNIIPADIVFVLKDRPHTYFRREDVNLIYEASISLAEALTGCVVDIMTLDERLIHVPITDIVSPGYMKVVPGEGMPKPSSSNDRGDLHIHFNIRFPKKLSPSQKEVVLSVLSE